MKDRLFQVLGLPYLASYKAGGLAFTWTRSEVPFTRSKHSPPDVLLLGQSFLRTYFDTFFGIWKQDPVKGSMDMKKRVLKEEKSAIFSFKTLDWHVCKSSGLSSIEDWEPKDSKLLEPFRSTAQISFSLKYDCYMIWKS